MKALSPGLIALVGIGSAVTARDVPPPAVVAHKTVHVQNVTHNDGKPHRQITHIRHRTIVKTPHGTMIRTTASTNTTPPK
ncbi:hypothetical protein HZF05_17810 [Sphingomonas sp. CGMCC 1.13654]|uniref:Uncharacterized protein n=1 Tax=Sphingomonas chungangi TaxID=2683589 RepID=A0A838LBH6_9SPHN|nr:hypothetical protein [Sphingomonas chungangi]MBA2935939.1 hypothetical protein [Sphingomonas chungangi]MVW54630.1 hypothetical protein [Sphingomonas chungangi]